MSVRKRKWTDKNGRQHEAWMIHIKWTAPDGTSQKPVDVIALAGPIPNDALFAHVSVEVDLRAKLLNVLMSPDPKLRMSLDALLRAESFRPATSAHFEPLRRMIATATARGEAPPSSRR